MSSETSKAGRALETPVFSSRPLHRQGELAGESFEQGVHDQQELALGQGMAGAPAPAADSLPLAGNALPDTYTGSLAEARQRWARLVSTAALAWGKLGDEELLNTAGDPRRLAALIADHYGIEQHVAVIQVGNFLEKHRV